MAAAELVTITERIAACRDPTDDKFLELAVNGHADLIVSGDGDLLALNPFRQIPIVTPAAFVQGWCDSITISRAVNGWFLGGDGLASAIGSSVRDPSPPARCQHRVPLQNRLACDSGFCFGKAEGRRLLVGQALARGAQPWWPV